MNTRTCFLTLLWNAWCHRLLLKCTINDTYSFKLFKKLLCLKKRIELYFYVFEMNIYHFCNYGHGEVLVMGS